MRRRLPFAICLLAATTAFGQPKFTVTPVPSSVTVPPGGTATGTVKVKYECNNCTATYNGGWELFQSFSAGFEREGNPTFACDPGPSCSVTPPQCMPVSSGEYGCFAQATLAPGATISDAQTIKQQAGGPTTGEWHVHVGNDIDSTFVVVPLGTGGAVCPDITILPATLPDLTVGGSLPNIQFTATGGNAPYTFSAPKDVAPGLTIEYGANPFLAGKPTTAGTYTFTVTAKDSTPAPPGPCTASKTYTLTVKPAASCPTITISPNTLPELTVGVLLNPAITPVPTFDASGGTPPYQWQFNGLPGGLTGGQAAGTGLITGTPTTAGTFNITVTATDSTPSPPGPCTVSKSYTLTIKPAAACPTITLTPILPIPEFTAGAAADSVIVAKGGQFPYWFQVTGLPEGMFSLLGGQHDNVIIYGVPLTVGTYNINVTVTDSTPSPPGPCTASQSFTLTVKPPAGPWWEITKTHVNMSLDSSKPFDMTYSIIIKNTGSAVAHGYSFKDVAWDAFFLDQQSSPCTLDFFLENGGRCQSAEDIPPNDMRTFTLIAKYKPPYTRDLENTAQVSGGGAPNTAKAKDVIRILNHDRIPSPQPSSPVAPNKGRSH